MREDHIWSLRRLNTYLRFLNLFLAQGYSSKDPNEDQIYYAWEWVIKMMVWFGLLGFMAYQPL